MSVVYKNKFMEKLKQFLEKEKKFIRTRPQHEENVYNQNWGVFALFGGPKLRILR